MGNVEQYTTTGFESERNSAAARIDAAIKTRNIHQPMTVEEVNGMDAQFRIGGGKKEIFGRTIEALVREGFSLTPDMYRITTFGPIAQEAAHYLVEVLKRYFPKNNGEKYYGIEGCTGTGSQTWALAKTGKLHVDMTVEKDPYVALFTRKNLERLGLQGLKSATAIADIVEILKATAAVNTGNGEGRKDWVMLDPDWYGKPYKSNKPFHLKDMDPNGESLVGLGLMVAPVVGIKAPETVGDDEFDSVARKFGVSVLVHDIELVAQNENHKERFGYFIDNPLLQKSDGIGLVGTSIMNINQQNK